MKAFRFFLSVAAMLALLAASVFADDPKPEEIVAKHVESIGKKDVRDSVKTLIAIGQNEFESLVPAIKGGGRGMVVSDPGNLMFALAFNSSDYPFERIGYFGTKVDIPYVSAGNRSFLGLFLSEHSAVVTSGLFTGAMSLRWPFLGQGGQKPNVNKSQSGKVDGRKCYVLTFVPKSGGSSELVIRLYFDAETFQHVQSEYRREIPAGFQTFGQQNQNTQSTLTLTEKFSNFKTVNGLTLPYSYSTTFVSNTPAATYTTTWRLAISEYVINQKLAPDFFTFDTK